MDAHGDGLSLRAFRHEHGADLLSVLRNLVFRNLLKGPCRTTFGALQRTGYCWVLMLSAGALELLLGIRPFIEQETSGGLCRRLTNVSSLQVVDFLITVLPVWIILFGGDVPQFVTAFPGEMT